MAYLRIAAALLRVRVSGGGVVVCGFMKLIRGGATAFGYRLLSGLALTIGKVCRWRRGRL